MRFFFFSLGRAHFIWCSLGLSTHDKPPNGQSHKYMRSARACAQDQNCPTLPPFNWQLHASVKNCQHHPTHTEPCLHHQNQNWPWPSRPKMKIPYRKSPFSQILQQSNSDFNYKSKRKRMNERKLQPKTQKNGRRMNTAPTPNEQSRNTK